MPLVGYAMKQRLLMQPILLILTMSGAFQQQLNQSQLSCSASPPIIQKHSLASFTHPLHMWAHWWLCVFLTRDISEYLFSWKKIRNEEGVCVFWRVGRGKTCCIYQSFRVLAHGPVFYTFMPPWFYNKCFDYIAPVVWPCLSSVVVILIETP